MEPKIKNNQKIVFFFFMFFWKKKGRKLKIYKRSLYEELKKKKKKIDRELYIKEIRTLVTTHKRLHFPILFYTNQRSTEDSGFLFLY